MGEQQEEAEMGEAKTAREAEAERKTAVGDRERPGLDSKPVTALILGGPGNKREAVTLLTPSESSFTPE